MSKRTAVATARTIGRESVADRFYGERQRLWCLLKELSAILAGDWQLVVSETINEWENLYKGYEKIKQVQSLQTFYPDLLLNEQIIQVDILDRNEALPFLSFNKALTIGDTKTVQDELDKIFSSLEGLQADPEHVRYVAFLLFNDIYRQFPVLTREIMIASSLGFEHRIRSRYCGNSSTRFCSWPKTSLSKSVILRLFKSGWHD